MVAIFGGRNDPRPWRHPQWSSGRIAHFFAHPHTNAADLCYLQDLFTAPQARGQGVGRALIEYVADWAQERGCSRVYSQTKQSNARARRLYDQVTTHAGFIVYQIDL